MPTLSGPVLSCSPFSPATYHRYHFPGKVTWNIPKSINQISCDFTLEGTQRRDSGSEGWKEQKSRKEKTNNGCICFVSVCVLAKLACKCCVTNVDPSSIALQCAKGRLGVCLRRPEGKRTDSVAVAAGATNTHAVCWSSDSARCNSQRNPCRQMKTRTHHAKSNMVGCICTDAHVTHTFIHCMYTPNLTTNDIKY